MAAAAICHQVQPALRGNAGAGADVEARRAASQ